MSKITEALQPELFEDYVETPEKPKPFSEKPASDAKRERITQYYTTVKNLTKDVGHFNEVYLLKKNLEQEVPHPESKEVFSKYHQTFETLDKKIARARRDCLNRFDQLESRASELGFKLSGATTAQILNHLALSADRRERYRAVAKREIKRLAAEPDRPILTLDDFERDYQALLVKRKQRQAKQSSTS